MITSGRWIALGILGLAVLLTGCEEQAVSEGTTPPATNTAESTPTAAEFTTSEIATPPPTTTTVSSGTESGTPGASTPASPAVAGNSPPAPTTSSATPPATTVTAAASPPAAAPRRKASRRGEPKEISFDDIKFDMVKGDPFLRTMLTPAIEALTGQRIRIRGYMLPSFQQSGLKQFILVRDNMQCCFGPGAALFDCVVINMVEGSSAEYSTRPVAVEGTFAVHEMLGPDGKHLAIYEMAGESVR